MKTRYALMKLKKRIAIAKRHLTISKGYLSGKINKSLKKGCLRAMSGVLLCMAQRHQH